MTDPVQRHGTAKGAATAEVRVKSLSPKVKHRAWGDKDGQDAAPAPKAHNNVVNIFPASDNHSQIEHRSADPAAAWHQRKKVASSEPPSEPNFVTSVLIEKPEDSGFQILSSKDEEAERSESVARVHDHASASSAVISPQQLNNQRYKPRRKKPGSVSIHHNSSQHEHVKRTNEGRKGIPVVHKP